MGLGSDDSLLVLQNPDHLSRALLTSGPWLGASPVSATTRGWPGDLVRQAAKVFRGVEERIVLDRTPAAHREFVPRLGNDALERGDGIPSRPFKNGTYHPLARSCE